MSLCAQHFSDVEYNRSMIDSPKLQGKASKKKKQSATGFIKNLISQCKDTGTFLYTESYPETMKYV